MKAPPTDAAGPSGSRTWTPRGRHLFVFDLVAVSLSILGALALRFDTADLTTTIRAFLPVALLPLLVQPIVNIGYGLYRREWRYASVRELIAITVAVATAAFICGVAVLVLTALGVTGTSGLPRSFIPLTALISLSLIGGGRFAIRVWWDANAPQGDANGAGVPSLVYGAGEAGAAIIRIALRDPGLRLRIVGLVDDDAAKRGSRLLGYRIFGGMDDLPTAVKKTGARQVIVAMPSAPGEVVRGAVETARTLGLEVRIVPPLQELLGAPDRLARVRPVRVDDLLRRAPVHVDLEELAGYVNGASALVTGAGGSIGAELARQIGRLGPRRLVLLDNSESSLWTVERDLRDALTLESGLTAVMADVRSLASLERVVKESEPDVVFHAAAMKHVPVCELQPSEAVLTNVVGTRNLLRVCDQQGVPRVVLISTDKAVHPISVMGATKRLAEMLTLEAAQRSERSYMVVRFGNVLGSSGSVVPIFQRQLELGMPLTITHPDATRYFMTIPEAVSLILQAGATSAVGDIFVLDMGVPVRIVDLASDMIRLSGLDPSTVEIIYTGLRPGERLEENLFYDHENVEATTHDRVWRVIGENMQHQSVDADTIAELERLGALGDDRAIRTLLVDRGVLQVGSKVHVG